MAHSTTIGDFVFIHNGDYTGTVLIKHKDSALGIEVPAHDLFGFVLFALRDQKISRLENMDAKELEEHFLSN